MIPYSISKEEVNELPLGQYEGPIHLIDKPHLVEDAVDYLEKNLNSSLDQLKTLVKIPSVSLDGFDKNENDCRGIFR